MHSYRARLSSPSAPILAVPDGTQEGPSKDTAHVLAPVSRSAPPTESGVEQAVTGIQPEQWRLAAGERSDTPPVPKIPSSLRTEHDVHEFEEARTMAQSGAATEIGQSLAIQHRRLLRSTDKALLKRTQLLHEQQKVETCRHFFDESLEALMAAFPTEPGGNAGRRKKRRKKPKKGKSREAMGAEGQANFLPSVDSGSQPETQISSEPLTKERETSNHASSEAATGPPRSPTKDVVAIFKQYREDYATLRTQEAHLKATLDDLSKLDFRIKEIQEAFNKSLIAANIIPNMHDQLPNGDLASSASSVQDKSVTDTPSLLAEYFSWKGDIGIYRERLEELEFHYHEGLVERAFLADRGDQLEVSDVQFDDNYLVRRRAIKRDLEDAEQQAAEFADRCLKVGYDITTHKKSRKPEPSSASSDSGSMITYSEVAAAEPLESNTSHVPTQSVPTSKRIDKWLRDLPASAAASVPSGEEMDTIAVEPKEPTHEYGSLASYEQRGFEGFGINDYS